MNSVEGIILSKTPRREADVIFEIYTQDLGIAHFQAKGVRQTKAKLRFGLDRFNHVQVFYVPSKYLPIITDVRVASDRPILKSDLYRIKLAEAVAVVLGRVMPPGLADEKIWTEVGGYFARLDGAVFSKEDVLRQTYFLFYRLLVLSGLKPELAQCTVCGRIVFGDRLTISLVNGGIVHYHCLSPTNGQLYRLANDTVLLNSAVLGLARVLGSSSWQAEVMPVADEVWQEFKKLTRIFFEYHFGVSLRELL